jgi:hypothetical protein
MDQNLREISSHMRGLGLGALTHANWHANYFSHDNPWWAELSVLQAAHAAEILIKARIAEEHPLLIFEQLPKSAAEEGQVLSLKQLVEKARTIQFADLPDRLWASTGKRLPNLERYHNFSRIRNTIQHFASPDHIDVSTETINFIYGVIDPFINDCWGLYAIDYNEDDEPYVYLVEHLIRRGVVFLVSPKMLDDLEQMRLEWPSDNPAYEAEMKRRFAVARIVK